jgi:predicted MFS family arabinose efflux permease
MMQPITKHDDHWSALTRVLAFSSFLLMFQAYLVAPLIPQYVKVFESRLMNFIIPVYAIPFAIGAFVTSILIARGARFYKLMWPVFAISMGCFMLAGAQSAGFFLLVRALTGIATGGIIPISLILVSKHPDHSKRGNGMMIIIFSLATGMTFAPVTGGWLNHIIGWRILYIGLGALSFLVFLSATKLRNMLNHGNMGTNAIYPVLEYIIRILKNRKFRKANVFIYLTGTFHSSVFVWISYYFTNRYQLDEQQLAVALLIFGLPGLLVVMTMARQPRQSRVEPQLYIGLFLVTFSILALLLTIPFWLSVVLIATLSVGYNLTQPLFIGIIKGPLNNRAARVAACIGCGVLFLGYGTGPLFVLFLLHYGRMLTLTFLGILQLMFFFFSLRVWSSLARMKNS